MGKILRGFTLLVALLLAALASCTGKPSPAPAVLGDPAVADGLVGPEGGRIVHLSDAALVVPQGAQSAVQIALTSSSFIIASTVVVIGDTALATSYVSGNQLNATVPASYPRLVHVLAVAVRTPALGGGSSTTAPF